MSVHNMLYFYVGSLALWAGLTDWHVIFFIVVEKYLECNKKATILNFLRTRRER
jgi:hypothetical protein